MEPNIDDLEKNRVVTNIENMFLAGRAKKYGIDMPAEKAKEVDPAYLANFRFAKGSEPTPEQSKLLDTLNENKYDISSSSDKAEIADLLKKSDLMFDLNATHGLSHDWTGLAKGFDAPSNMNDNKKDYEKNMKEQVVYLPSSYINRISNELNEVEKLLDANEKIQDKLIERNEYNQSNNIYSDLYKSSLSFKDKDDFGFNEYKAKDHICNIKMAIKDYQKSFKLHLPQDIANRIDKASERIVNRNFKRLISEKARTGDTLNYQMKYSTDKRLKPANAAPDLNKDRSKNVERKASEPKR